MQRTRVKICGITNVEDAQAAVAAGADALGFNFYEASPRHVSASAAASICAQLPPFVTIVGLFVNANAGMIERIINSCPLSVLQFSGDEAEPFCAGFSLPYIKALRVSDINEAVSLAGGYRSAAALMIDRHVEGQFGGTGETLDWQPLPELPRPVILAGGLRPTNVAQAMAGVRPWAVDVSSGIERSKGKKDASAMREFVAAVQRADAVLYPSE